MTTPTIMIERGRAHPPERLASVWAEVIHEASYHKLSDAECRALLWALAQCDDFLQVFLAESTYTSDIERAVLRLGRRGVIRAQRCRGGLEIQLIRRLGGAA